MYVCYFCKTRINKFEIKKFKVNGFFVKICISCYNNLSNNKEIL